MRRLLLVAWVVVMLSGCANNVYNKDSYVYDIDKSKIERYWHHCELSKDKAEEKKGQTLHTCIYIANLATRNGTVPRGEKYRKIIARCMWNSCFKYVGDNQEDYDFSYLIRQ